MVSAQTELMDVEGSIKIGNTTESLEAGTIRYNPATEDIEGFNGTTWLSLSQTAPRPMSLGADKNPVTQSATIPQSFSGDGGFGNATAIDGNYLVVGAYRQNGFTGAAYIYCKTPAGWVEKQTITAPDADALDSFGYTVSISGDILAIGSTYDDDLGTNSGSVYTYKLVDDQWVLHTKLTAFNGHENMRYGISVSLCNNDLIVGARYSFGHKGAAYVYTLEDDSWSLQGYLKASEGDPGDDFGYSVSISGNHAIIGAPRLTYEGGGYGKVYIFSRENNAWSEQAIFTPDDEYVYTPIPQGYTDDYGASVAISGNYAIIGAPALDWDNQFPGTVEILCNNNNTWEKEVIMEPSDGKYTRGTSGYWGPADRYGFSVAIKGNMAIVGAIDDSNHGTNSGSAYILKRDAQGWYEYTKLLPSNNSSQDKFGYSVSTNGTNICIGAREMTAVFIY